jgi:hypothetical protein
VTEQHQPPAALGGRVLDASALVNAATGKSVYVRALIRVAVEHGVVLSIPAAAVMSAVASMPGEALAQLAVLLELPVTITENLDAADAAEAGIWLATTAKPETADTSAGQVSWSAHRRGWPIVTSEPERYTTLAAGLDVEALP